MKHIILKRNDLSRSKRQKLTKDVSIYDFHSVEFNWRDRFNECSTAVFIDGRDIKILKDKHSNMKELIAAAPELLEALQLIKLNGFQIPSNVDMIEVEQAIKKATK